MTMTQEQMQADWSATRNIAEIQQQLDIETDDEKLSILTQMLACEFAKLRKPKSGVIDSDRVTVDVGNPAIGFVIGFLLISATMGGFFLWSNSTGARVAKSAVVTAQSR